jgi:beta propeller repeat protein
MNKTKAVFLVSVIILLGLLGDFSVKPAKADMIETPICTNPESQSNPAVSGDIIVWTDYRNGMADIFMYDLSTDTETPICTTPSRQWGASVSGHTIVWTDDRNGNYDIYMCDLASFENYAKVVVEDARWDFVDMKLGVQNIAGERLWEFMPEDGWWLDETTVEWIFDISDFSSNLPPDDDNTWFVEVTAVADNQAKITEFSIKHWGITYTSTDPIVPIIDLEPAYAYIPPCTESGEYEPPHPPCCCIFFTALAVAIIIIIIFWIYRRKKLKR